MKEPVEVVLDVVDELDVVVEFDFVDFEVEVGTLDDGVAELIALETLDAQFLVVLVDVQFVDLRVVDVLNKTDSPCRPRSRLCLSAP